MKYVFVTSRLHKITVGNPRKACCDLFKRYQRLHQGKGHQARSAGIFRVAVLIGAISKIAVAITIRSGGFSERI